MTVISALFHEGTDPEGIHVTGFAGDPHSRADAKWYGRRVGSVGIAGMLRPDTNNFVCMGELNVTTRDRSLLNVVRHHSIWMDDVGTKIKKTLVENLRSAFGLIPTVVLETSPGNYSYFWRLDKPVDADGGFGDQTVAAVRHTIKTEGWGDPAAQDAARYMRLPGVNGKKAYAGADGSPFVVKVVEFSPNTTVSLADMASALMGSDWEGDVLAGTFATSRAVMAGQVGASNDRRASMDMPLVKLAAAVGLDPQPSTRQGVIDAHCPNEANHTGGDPTGYAIINDGMSFCNHASCQHLHSLDFRDMMIERYDVQVQAGLALGFYVENPLGPGLLDARTGDNVPTSGQGFLAGARFEDAGMETREDLLGEASRIASDQADRAEEMALSKDEAVKALAQDLIHVDEAEAFWHRSKKILMQPSRFDKDEEVIKVVRVGGTGTKRASNIVLNTGLVTHVDTMVKVPGGKEIEMIPGPDGGTVSAVNTYVPGSIGRRAGTPTKFLAHVRNLFASQPDIGEYLIETFAWMLQNPAAKTPIITLLGGEQGIGKDFLLQCFYRLVGPHNVATASITGLVDGYNDFVTFPYVTIGEFTLAGRDGERAYSALKDLTSENVVARTINPKYGKRYRTVVSPRFFATTNDPDSMTGVDAEDRRVFVAWSEATRVHGASGHALQPFTDAYFDDLWQTYLAGRTADLEILNDYLLRLPIKKFSPSKAPPRSAARHDTLVASLGPTAQFVYDLVTTGDLAGRRVVSFGEIETRALASDNQMVRSRVTPRAIQHGLRLAGCRSLRQVRVGPTKRVRLWSGACVPAIGVGMSEDERKNISTFEPGELLRAFTDEIAETAKALAAG